MAKNEKNETAAATQEMVGKLTIREIFAGKCIAGRVVRIAGRVDSRKVKVTNLGECVCFSGAFAGQLLAEDGVTVERVVVSNRAFMPHIAESFLATVKDGEEFKLSLTVKADSKSTVGYTFGIKLDAQGLASNPALRLLAAF